MSQDLAGRGSEGLVVGRYGTAVLAQDAPERVRAQVLEALGGPPAAQSVPVAEAEPRSRPAAERSGGTATGVWTDPEDLCLQDPDGVVGAVTSDEPPDDGLAAPGSWGGPLGYPEPAPGSGRRRRGRSAQEAASSASAPGSGPGTPSADLPAGPEPSAPATDQAPVVALLRVSTGALIEVRGDVILGRAPQPLPGTGPQRRAATVLVVVPSPTHTVSRSHLALTVTGEHVLARDLGSGNGTVLVRPGIAPVMLTTGFPTPLLVGDLLDVGDGVTACLEAVR